MGVLQKGRRLLPVAFLAESFETDDILELMPCPVGGNSLHDCAQEFLAATNAFELRNLEGARLEERNIPVPVPSFWVDSAFGGALEDSSVFFGGREFLRPLAGRNHKLEVLEELPGTRFVVLEHLIPSGIQEVWGHRAVYPARDLRTAASPPLPQGELGGVVGLHSPLLHQHVALGDWDLRRLELPLALLGGESLPCGQESFEAAVVLLLGGSLSCFAFGELRFLGFWNVARGVNVLPDLLLNYAALESHKPLGPGVLVFEDDPRQELGGDHDNDAGLSSP